VVQVVAGVESVAQQAGYGVFLCNSHDDPQREIDVVDTLHRRRVDVIIVTSSRVGSLYTKQLDRMRVPIVLINNQSEGQYLYSVRRMIFKGRNWQWNTCWDWGTGALAMWAQCDDPGRASGGSRLSPGA